jgi:gamma-glutamyl-gamma-aminobutyraldehyde dehydrogenase
VSALADGAVERAAFESDVWSRAASLYTDDRSTARALSRSIRAGTVSVNCYAEGDVTTPFGGYEESGFGGRDNGLQAFDQYTEYSTVWIDASAART